MKRVECDVCGVETGVGFMKRHKGSESCKLRININGERRKY